ncbi:hypothetical protein [Arcobacter sp.]|uniref:hypothetical protein n=2 Tax=Arcobacter sp. TaxID=1872629 RepID=UPI003D10F37D
MYLSPLLQHNAYQNSIAQDTVGDISFILENNGYNAMADTNNHVGSVNQVTSTPSVFNSQTANNNIEFTSLNKEQGDNSIYLYGGKVVATDGINDNKVIDLTTWEAITNGFMDNYLISSRYLVSDVEKINPEDTSRYDNVYDLTNKKDFEALRKDTDMNYDNIDKNTKIVFENGMMNDYADATKLQQMIQKDFPNSSIGLINNETGKITGVLNDAVEWLPNYYTTKDVLNAYQLQQLSPNAIIITHSAGNEDIYKANNVNSLVNAQTPYYLISAGSPKSKSELEKSASKVGAVVITQINHSNDPVANGWLNGDANYNIDFSQKIPIWDDLKNNHPFTNYYYNEGVKEEIQKAINK